MQLGDKIIITGGTETDWLRYEKPYYITTTIHNSVVQAYQNREVLVISAVELQNDVKVFDLVNSRGKKFFGFGEWELELSQLDYQTN